VAGIDDREATVGQSLVEELGVDERHGTVVAAVDDRDWRGDLRQEIREDRQFLGISADIAHRLVEAVAGVAVHVVRTDVVGHPPAIVPTAVLTITRGSMLR
jgi:hypothetical protein